MSSLWCEIDPLLLRASTSSTSPNKTRSMATRNNQRLIGSLKRPPGNDASNLSQEFQRSSSSDISSKVDGLISVKDLAVSKQKLNELRTWLTDYFDTKKSLNKKSPFLLLNGPSGSGKTSALKLLTKEMNIKCIELPTTSIFDESNILSASLNQMSIGQSIKTSSIEECSEIDFIKPLCQESQLNRFKRFLNDLNNYKKSIFDPDETFEKVLVIEDIPSLFMVKPYLLHDEMKHLLRKFETSKRIVPLVFIISSTITAGESIEQKILPKFIQCNLNFHVITFKAVTDFCLSKALNNSSTGRKLNKQQIEEIVQSSSGDIRHAFNYLDFKYSTHYKNSSVKRKKYSKETAIECDRNDPLTLSYGIAKILYAKRLDIGDEHDIRFIKTYSNCDQNKLRNPLKESQPEDIAERANISIENLSDWIHENYLDFIHDDNDLDGCIDCLEILSESIPLNDFYETSSTTANESNSSGCEKILTSYLTRGIMFNINRDRDVYDKLISGKIENHKMKKNTNQFRPLRPPKTYNLKRELTNNHCAMNELKTFFQNECDKNLILDVLPLISQYPKKLIQEPKLKSCTFLLDFISYLSNFDHLPPQHQQKFQLVSPSKMVLMNNNNYWSSSSSSTSGSSKYITEIEDDEIPKIDDDDGE